MRVGAAADLLQHGQGRRRRGRVRPGDVEILLVQGAEPRGTAPKAGGGDPGPGPPSRQQPDGVRPRPGVLSCSGRRYCLG